MKMVVIGGGPAGVESALTGSMVSDDVTLITDGRVGEWKSALPNLWMTFVDIIKKKGTFDVREFEQKRLGWENDLEQQLKTAQVKVVHGKAVFETGSTIKVTHHDGGERIVAAHKVIIANGTRPFLPEAMKPDGERIFSFQNVNKLQVIPDSIIVIGHSPIGYEMVHLFQQLGCKVKWLLPNENQPLFDKDITQYFVRFFEEKGVELIHGPFVKKLINDGEGVTAIRNDGDSFESDYAFITLGFTSNIDQLHILNADLSIESNGILQINEYGQTENPNIYVVGDAHMPFSAVHSMATGHVAALHASNQNVEAISSPMLPLSFNENPQVSTVGYVDATNPAVSVIKIPYDQRQFRAFMTDEREGFLKMVFNKEKVIIGATCIGAQAKDIITIIALMIKLKVKAPKVSTFFSSHPSALELPFVLIRDSFFKL